MPCHAAITEQFLILSPDANVEKAMKELKKKKIDWAAVVNDQGVIEGLFSLRIVMKNLLPVSVAMSDGIKLDITVRAAPGIAKRLRKVYPLTVADLMDRQFERVSPDTPIWEAISHLVHTDTPLAVVDGDKDKFIGLITAQSGIDELQRLEQSE